MRTLWRDVIYGCRMWARSPGFSVVVVLILAVGIGVNTTIFTAVKAWLSVWSFLCDRPERIVLLSEHCGVNEARHRENGERIRCGGRRCRNRVVSIS